MDQAAEVAVAADGSAQPPPPAHALYSGMVLAPMVRAGTTPLRHLALEYGATAVWGEELIARRLAATRRQVNPTLGTVDFVDPGGKVAAIVLRTYAAETSRFICQLGTADPETALAAARVVEKDVAGIDINMGCPKKFSVSGGMGAALLKQPDVAESIVRTLASALSVPVSVKIRLLDTSDQTVAFARRMQAAGASALTVHLRKPGDREHDPAQKDQLKPVVDALDIPVLANGDFYSFPEMVELKRTTRVAGFMLARPALYNCSIFGLNRRFGLAGPCPTKDVLAAAMRPLDEVIRDYVRACLRFDVNYQNAKYTVVELMNTRRHHGEWGKNGKGKHRLQGPQTMGECSRVRSLAELAKIWHVDVASAVPNPNDGSGGGGGGSSSPCSMAVAVDPARSELGKRPRSDDDKGAAEPEEEQAASEQPQVKRRNEGDGAF